MKYTVSCPWCGGTELASNDMIRASCAIETWTIENGTATPNEYTTSGTEVDWDSQTSNPEKPYICTDCWTECA
jgi:hypothetical protein